VLWLALVFATLPFAIGILVELAFFRNEQIIIDLAVPLIVTGLAQSVAYRLIKKTRTKS
jgi:hypothetical protein